MKEYSAENYKCEYCNNDISLLTLKLQQHPTSQLWLRHGQCCAACKSAGELEGVNNKESVAVLGRDKSFNDNGIQPEDSYNIIINTPASDGDIEDEAKLNMRKRAGRTIKAGNIIASISLVACFLFFYNEYFFLSIASLIIAIAGIVLCRLAIWKKCRIE